MAGSTNSLTLAKKSINLMHFQDYLILPAHKGPLMYKYQ
jgi:hypothetical protein